MNITQEQPTTIEIIKRARQIAKKRDKTEDERAELASLRLQHKEITGNRLSLNELIRYS